MSSQYQQPLKFVKHKLGLVILLMFGAVITTPAQAILIGPSGGAGLAGEYAQFSDSPFFPIDFSGGYFHLDNFDPDFLRNALLKLKNHYYHVAQREKLV